VDFFANFLGAGAFTAVVFGNARSFLVLRHSDYDSLDVTG
jgi:hypothetical protein